MTYAQSDLLFFFLEAAHNGGSEEDTGGERTATARDFEVLVCETAPDFSGHATVKTLAKAGIQANLITDASVYAVMSRVDKVYISCHAVLANGGIMA